MIKDAAGLKRGASCWYLLSSPLLVHRAHWRPRVCRGHVKTGKPIPRCTPFYRSVEKVLYLNRPILVQQGENAHPKPWNVGLRFPSLTTVLFLLFV